MYKEFVNAIGLYIIEHEEKIDQNMTAELEMTMQQAATDDKGTATYSSASAFHGFCISVLIIRTDKMLLIGDKEEGKDEIDADEEDEGEEEDMPEEFQGLTPEQQQFRIKSRSFWMMGLGTLVVLLVSDPMVDVLSALGDRTGIPAFYVAFLLAPMASNASELIAAYNYARKKTSSSISISMATLLGAAVMNNTFVLGEFRVS